MNALIRLDQPAPALTPGAAVSIAPSITTTTKKG
jgi:hypothetical protein